MNLNNVPLCKSLGINPTIKLLAFFIAHKDFDYSKTELANNVKLARQTIYKALEPLLNYNMIIISRKIGNTTLYKINTESESIKAIKKYNDTIIDIIIENEKKIEIKETGEIDDVIQQLHNKFK